MKCREVVEFLMDYLNRDLADGERDAFDRHCVDCPPCKTYLESYKESVRLGKCICDDPEGPVPADVPDELVRAILAAREQT